MCSIQKFWKTAKQAKHCNGDLLSNIAGVDLELYWKKDFVWSASLGMLENFQNSFLQNTSSRMFLKSPTQQRRSWKLLAIVESFNAT